MNAYDIVGILSSIILTCMFIPQIYQTYKTADVSSFHPVYISMNFIASILGFIYATHFRIIPMIIINISSFIFTSVLMYYKFIYRPRVFVEMF